MMPIIIVITILILAFILFATELLSIDLVAVLIILSLVITGILTPQEAVHGFSNSAVLTIAAMFILSGGLLRTGAVTVVSKKIIEASGSNPQKMLLLSMITVAFVSAFINNIPVVVIFVPIIIAIGNEFQISPSKLLIPISFASIVGGTCTLIGTSTNILVSAVSEEHGFGELKMFEFTQMGLVFAGLGILYIRIFGQKLLPDRKVLTSYLGDKRTKEYLTEVEVRKGSALIGKKLNETFMSKQPGIAVFEIIRGEKIIWPPLDNVVILEGDVLLMRGPVTEIMSIHQKEGLQLLPELTTGKLKFDPQKTTLVELVILPNSSFIGEKIREVGFRRHYNLTVMAIQRYGEHIRRNIAEMRLRSGDVLLVFGDENIIGNLSGGDDFIILETVQEVVLYKNKAPIAVFTVLSIIALAALNILPIMILVLCGVVVMIVTGCITLREAYKSVDFKLLVLIAGTLALGTAMETTGTAQLLADKLISSAGFLGPVAVLSAMYFLTSALTSVMTNTAAAVLLAPIAISTAESLSLNPKAFVIAVMFAASASFATPIGYQTNTFIYGPGGYKFSDFAKIGIPMNILFWIAATFLIPWFWPL